MLRSTAFPTLLLDREAQGYGSPLEAAVVLPRSPLLRFHCLSDAEEDPPRPLGLSTLGYRRREWLPPTAPPHAIGQHRPFPLVFQSAAQALRARDQHISLRERTTDLDPPCR